MTPTNVEVLQTSATVASQAGGEQEGVHTLLNLILFIHPPEVVGPQAELN